MQASLERSITENKGLVHQLQNLRISIADLVQSNIEVHVFPCHILLNYQETISL